MKKKSGAAVNLVPLVSLAVLLVALPSQAQTLRVRAVIADGSTPPANFTWWGECAYPAWFPIPPGQEGWRQNRVTGATSYECIPDNHTLSEEVTISPPPVNDTNDPTLMHLRFPTVWGFPAGYPVSGTYLETLHQTAWYECDASGCSITLLFRAKKGTAEGRVLLLDGAGDYLPIAGVVVAAYRQIDAPPYHAYVAQRRTDGNGRFDFTDPDPESQANNWGLRVDPPYGYEEYSLVVGEFGSQETPPYKDADSDGISVYSSQRTIHDIVRSSLRQQGQNPNNRAQPVNNQPQGGGPPAVGTSSCPPRGMGKPVNLVTGGVFFAQADAALPGVNRVLELVRTYNSGRAYAGHVGAFGRGWEHSYEKAITAVIGNGLLRLDKGDAGPILFGDFDGDLTYQPFGDDAEKSWLVQSASGYVRHFVHGGQEVYDLNGRLVSEADRVGNETTFQRDESGRLTGITLPGRRSLTFQYQGDRVSQLLGPAGVIAGYTYTGDLLTQVGYPDGSGYTFVYDSSGQVLSVSDPTNRVLEAHAYSGGKATTSELADGRERQAFTYYSDRTVMTDALGRVTTFSLTNAGSLTQVSLMEGACGSCGSAGPSQRWFFDSKGRVSGQRNANLEEWDYTYGETGHVIEELDPLGRATSYTRDGFGRVLTRTDPGGAVTTLSYGLSGPLTIADPLQRTTSVSYQANGLPTSVTDARGKTMMMTYNSFGDLTSVTDPLGHTTEYSYDAMGRPLTVKDAANRTSSFTYDPRGRLTRVTRPDGTHVDYEYDLGGRMTQVTDTNGRATRYSYDPYARLVAVRDALDQVTRYEYDAMSRLTALVDASGRKTMFEYDAYDRLSGVVYPGGGSETLAYDSVGRLETKTDRRGVISSYEYDGLGRLSRQEFSDGSPARVLIYDAAGRLASSSNSVDTLTWTYDMANQVLSERSARSGKLIAYAYDDVGRRVNLSIDGSLYLSHGYDDDSRLTSLAKGTTTFAFGYDEVHRRTSLARTNGPVTAYTYDILSRLTGIGVTQAGSTLWSVGYTHDAAGNRLSKTLPDHAERYAYDATYRLSQVERTASLNRRWQFGYDAVGNRTSTQTDMNAIQSSFNESNQLLSTSVGGPLMVRGTLDEPSRVKVNGQDAKMLPGNLFEATIQANPGTNTFTVEATDTSGNVRTDHYSIEVQGNPASYAYDANGNLASKSEGGSSWTYEWNALNQLVRVTKDGAEVALFKYDPLGRRVEKVAGGVTTSWAYDGADILRATVNDGTTTTTYRYIHGPGIDEPLARENASTGAMECYHADGLGSIVKMTDQAGAVVHSYEYDAWGNIEFGSDRGGYAFTGREWDPETGLYYYRARYYDPKLGRFISEDPIGLSGGVNFYGYAGNSPMNFTDSLGLWSPPGHDSLFGRALSGAPGASPLDIATIQAASRSFDVQAGLSFTDSYKHSMRDWFQSPADALAKRDAFVAERLAKAAALEAQGRHNDALEAFAEGAHTIADSYSPEHVDAQGNPMRWPSVGHSPTDSRGYETSADITSDISVRATRAIRAAYDKVFSKQCK